VAWAVPDQVPTGYPADDALAARRAGVAAMEALDPSAPGISVEERPLGGVPCVVCRPDHPRAALIHLHGGGYRLGTARASAAFGARLASATGATVALADYRLAPEHPFPAALLDALAVYQALAAEVGSTPVVAGDSAGGGLAVAVALACRRSAVPMPSGLVLFSPWADLTVSAPTFAANAATDQLFSATSAGEAAAAYLQGHDPADPLVSPVFADADELADLAPTLVFAGGEEVLLDDALALVGALARAKVSVEAHLVAGMQHVWPTLFPDLPESAAALQAVARFVGRLDAGTAPAP